MNLLQDFIIDCKRFVEFTWSMAPEDIGEYTWVNDMRKDANVTLEKIRRG